MQQTRASATVITSNVNRAARELGIAHRYDVLLHVFPVDGEPFRVRLDDVPLGEMLPEIGSIVTVALMGDATAEHPSVEIVWQGDPNLDLAARRREMARLADLAQQRRAPRQE